MTKQTIIDTLMTLVDEYAEARHRKGHSTYNIEVHEHRAKVKAAITAALTFIPQFDAMAPKQEELAFELSQKIAGLKGEPPSPPDPVRLLEMAEELYLAEMRHQIEVGGLQQEVATLAVWALDALGIIQAGTPDKNCSCHISSPCLGEALKAALHE